MASPDSPRTVVFPLYPGSTLLDFGGATQVFAFAGPFQVIWAAESSGPIPTSEGVQVLPGKTFAELEKEGTAIDILFVPGGGESDGKGVATTMLDETYIEFLKTAACSAQWVGSVCTGAFLLATAGLFDDCRVTTYWSQLPSLKLFPNLKVVTEGYPRWVLDEERRRFSGGGISSSIDLSLELVQRFLGVEARQKVQLSIQYAPAPPDPPSGDPSKAPPPVTVEVCESQADFVAAVREATLQVTGVDSVS